ncbi:MAG: hypothetical protein Aureis2KO_00540 [Aureisphaera sp.]
MSDAHIHVFKLTRIVQNMLIISFPAAIATGWKLLIDWNRKQKETQELEIEKKETELKYLKSQVNPHFLFNNLNNIYSLSLERSEKVSDLILKLSEFLSFSLYETSNKTIPIKKEIDLILNFIELQTDRFADRVEVLVDIQEPENFLEIPPVLLIPFVENAFKHSLKNETGKAFINIRLSENNNTLSLEVENSQPENIQEASENKGGIGLVNIKRRLELLYGEKHSLRINETSNTFRVRLELKNEDEN